MCSYYHPIADPKYFSFEAQLCIVKRAMELSRIREQRYRGRSDLKYLHDPCVEGLYIAEKKVKILENLVALYSPKHKDYLYRNSLWRQMSVLRHESFLFNFKCNHI